jgi:hypothetical protein
MRIDVMLLTSQRDRGPAVPPEIKSVLSSGWRFTFVRWNLRGTGGLGKRKSDIVRDGERDVIAVAPGESW